MQTDRSASHAPEYPPGGDAPLSVGAALFDPHRGSLAGQRPWDSGERGRQRSHAGARIGRGVVALGLAIATASCAWAPGMHMDQADMALPRSDGSTVPVPLHPITLDLVENQVRDASTATSTLPAELFQSQSAPYHIGVGDVLSIVVWDHPELTPPLNTGQTLTTTAASDPIAGFIVASDGTVQFPYIGNIRLAGLTDEQARDRLTPLLARYLQRPQVTVRVISFRSQRIFVDGDVKEPGVYTINDIPMSVYEAVNRAGGFLPTADQSRLQLVRDSRTYLLDFPEMIGRGQNPGLIRLRHGDALRIATVEDSKVFMMGEVAKADPVPMRNGRLSLTQALAAAQGVDRFSAKPSEVYVIRNLPLLAVDGNGASVHHPAVSPQVFWLQSQSPTALLLANQFALRPNDVVYVEPTGLARFSRVLNQLIPGGSLVDNANSLR